MAQITYRKVDLLPGDSVDVVETSYKIIRLCLLCNHFTEELHRSNLRSKAVLWVFKRKYFIL